MPVTMRFGITETRSENKARQLLAAILKANSAALTEWAGDRIGIDRSLNLESGAAELESLSASYFDALLDMNTTSPESDDELEESERKWATAKESYNAARIANGLTPND